MTITSKMNALATCYIKSWLGLCHSTTVAVIHHPSILNIPALDSCFTSAKLSYLSPITLSPGPLIEQISHNTQSVPFGRAHGIAKSARDELRVARESLECISKKSLGNAVWCYHREYRKDRWQSHLSGLDVQCKFLDGCTLENDNKVWSRIACGLPPGQLLFVLRAASDTLPTPLNLRRWRYRIDSKCQLCGSNSPTVLHILNACPTSLCQGRFTWCHDSILSLLVNRFAAKVPEDVRIYVDFPGWRACNNPPGTIPVEFVATSVRLHIVVVRGNTIHLLELTVPFNSPESLKNAQSRKNAKANYQLVLSECDCKGGITIKAVQKVFMNL